LGPLTLNNYSGEKDHYTHYIHADHPFGMQYEN